MPAGACVRVNRLRVSQLPSERECDVATEIRSEITGKVWKVEASVGDQLTEDEPIIILESMKMEIPIAAPGDGKVVEIRVAEEDVVNEGDIVAIFEQ